MSKFLDLVIESTPSEGKGPFTVEYKDVDGNLMATAIIPDNVGSSYENFINFVETAGGKLNVNNAEDQEVVSGPGKYDIDAEVNKLAAKAKSGAAGLVGKVFSTGAQKAKKAVKQREKIAKDAIEVYKNDTETLKQAVIKK